MLVTICDSDLLSLPLLSSQQIAALHNGPIYVSAQVFGWLVDSTGSVM